MTYTAKITLKYDSTWEQTRGIYDEEMIPEEHITFETPVEDMNTIQLFQFFAKFASAMGHNEAGIAKGACYVAFNEMRTTEAMRKTADDYDLKLIEDYNEKIREYEEEVHQLSNTIVNLREKLARVLPQDSANEDFPKNDGNKCDTYKSWGGYLIPGSYAAVENGCKCPVMDNEEMPDDKKWVNGDCPLHGFVGRV